jgi:hypothetical protein
MDPVDLECGLMDPVDLKCGHMGYNLTGGIGGASLPYCGPEVWSRLYLLI